MGNGWDGDVDEPGRNRRDLETIGEISALSRKTFISTDSI